MKILAFDPSGNFKEGKGTTGYAIGIREPKLSVNSLPELGDIKAEEYTEKCAYWNAHISLIEHHHPDMVVIESYRLFGHKAKEQTGSSLETAQLIGVLEMWCWDLGIPVVFQDPSTKTRHSDEQLLKSRLVEKRDIRYFYKGELTNMHKRDALRHYLYFAKYGVKKFGKTQ